MVFFIILTAKLGLYHKIGGVIINGTDNIIISKYINILTVGLYSNYYLIINSVKNLFSQFISSITASVGNLLIERDIQKSYKIYKRIRFLNFWLACFSGICLLIMIQSFIKIWIGESYLLTNFVLYILIFNFYQKMMRTSNDLFLSAAGICVENKYVPLVESVLNIFTSVILVKFFGLAGVFMGTIISGLALWCYSYPKFVYKKLFNRSYLQYAKETLGYIGLFLLLAILTYCISTLCIVSNNYLQVIINLIISIVVPNTILLILFHKTENFKYFLELLKKIGKKVINRLG